MATRIHDDQFDSEKQTVEETIYRRTYRAGSRASLSDLSLAPGDSLPENASAEILESWLDRTRARDPRTGKPTGGWLLVARVVARTANTGA